MAWLSWVRSPRRAAGGAGARRPGEGLAGRPALADPLAPSAYEMTPGRQEQARAEIADLIERLRPGALDAGSREVLNNLINARTDAQLAELDGARDERQAVVDNLVALAAEQVARYKPRYDADLARVAQTGSVLAATYEALTGRTPTEFVPPRPRRAGDGPIESTLGPIDLSDDALPPSSAPRLPSEHDRGPGDVR